MKKRIAMTACVALVFGTAAGAETPEAPDVQHEPTELAALLQEPVDAPRADTALVFSSVVDEERRVVCRARDARGEVIGHAAARVPPHGVAHLRASDFAGGGAFAGQVRCRARRGVRASGFLRTANGVTTLRVAPLRGGAIHFPVVLTR